MAYLQTRALVLKKSDFGEYDCLVTLLTEERGLVKAVVKGVRKPGAKLAAVIQPFTFTEAMLHTRPHAELYRLTQARLLNGFPGLKTDLERIGYGSFLSELVMETVHGEEPSAAVFDLVLEAFGRLEASTQPALYSLLFTFQFLTGQGYRPHLADCVRCHAGLQFPRAFYSSLEGGMLCEACARRARTVPVKFQESRDFLREACAGHIPSEFPEALAGRDRGRELKALAEESVSHHCGKELKSLSFLQKVLLSFLAILLPFAFLLFTSPAFGIGSTGPDSLKIEMDARAVAMGSADVAVGENADAAAWNPASLVRVEAAQTGLAHFIALSDTLNDQVAAVVPLSGTYTLGASFLYSAMTPFAILDDQGTAVDMATVTDSVASLTVADHLTDGVALGVTVKYFSSQLYVYQASGWAADVGGLVRLPLKTNQAYLGASVTNLGTGVAYLTAADPLPTKLRAGAGYGFWTSDTDRHVLGLDLEWPLATDERRLVNLGYEWWLGRLFFLRAGYRWNAALGNLTLGLGFLMQGWHIDYAYIPFSGLGDTQRLSLLIDWK